MTVAGVDPNTAVDGQTLGAQGSATENAFVAQYGAVSAPSVWVTQHNQQIGFDSNMGDPFNTKNGVLTIQQIGEQLAGANYQGPWNESALVSAYASTTGAAVTVYAQTPQNAALPVQTANGVQTGNQIKTTQPTNPSAPSGTVTLTAQQKQWLTWGALGLVGLIGAKKARLIS